MSFFGIIPARGGSKGIPKKSIALCAGKPLLAFSCAAALASRGLKKTILSTDDEDIAKVGAECGISVPFRRPKDLASDTSSMVSVMEHALEWIECNGESVEGLVLLQPTS